MMKIILGITGSIAAYKSYDLLREWVKSGYEVKVILTSGSLKFINKELFTYLGASSVYGPEDDFCTDRGNSILHIELARWCDRVVICPLSANTLCRISHGEASDLLTTLLLALNNKPIILYPAMNTQMLNHPFQVEHQRHLQTLPNIFIHPPESGLLACGEEGYGKLPSVMAISELAPIIPTKSLKDNKNRKKKILINCGATVSPLDPVRYLTNPSSGITGYLIAKEFLRLGYFVTLLCGKNGSHPYLEYFAPLKELIHLHYVNTTKEMERAVLEKLNDHDLFISSAAISDFEFDYSKDKMKKNSSEKEGTISYKIAPDILENSLKKKRDGQTFIGFAAETNLSEVLLEEKWNRKRVDLLIGNEVHSGIGDKDHEIRGFSGDSKIKNEYLFYSPKSGNEKNSVVTKFLLSKEELAKQIAIWYESKISHT